MVACIFRCGPFVGENKVHLRTRSVFIIRVVPGSSKCESKRILRCRTQHKDWLEISLDACSVHDAI